MPLQEGDVISFCALLYAEHGGGDVTRYEVHRLNADEQDVAALRQQLPQFAGDRIRQTLAHR